MVLQKPINVIYISDLIHAGYLDLKKDPSRTFPFPASICSDSVVTEHCSPGLTLTSEENSIAGSVDCQMTSLERLMLVYLTHYNHLRAIPSITGRSEDLGEDEKEEVTWFPIRWRLALPSLLSLKCFLSREQRTLRAPASFVRFLRPLWRAGRVGQLRRVEPPSEFSNGWRIVKWRESHQD